MFGPVSGSSSVGTGVGASICFTGAGSAFHEELITGGFFSTGGLVGVGSVRTAFGFEGAFKVSSHQTFSGLGVIKSRSAEAPSVIVAHDVPIPAITVRVYELASTRTSSRVKSTAWLLSETGLIESRPIALLSDCFVILSTTLSGSIASEKLIRTCLLSVTFTELTVRGAVTPAANKKFHVKHTRRREKIDLKKLFIPWGFRKNRYTLQNW